MSRRIEKGDGRLGRQSDPEPPDYTPPRPPSLVLYAILFALAVALIASAFFIDSQNVDGLLINLATELLGAILILILVERRIRASEMRFLRALPGTTRETFSEWFSAEMRQVKTYARIFAAQLDSVSRPYYLPVSDVESELLSNRAKGFVLVGQHGSGRSTQLHRLASRQLSEVLERPRKAHVPVLVPILKWESGDAADVLRTMMQSYSPVSDRVFRRLLKGGRLMCMFDGLDESPRLREVVEGLYRFHEAHPNAPLIISTRNAGEPFLEDLPRINMRELSREEVEQIINLRRLNRDDVID
jgi:hypothetical protein